MNLINYSEEENVDWWKKIGNVEEIILYNFDEPTCLHPLFGYEADDYSVFYHISKLQNKKISFINPDVNLFENFKVLNEKLKIECDIKIYRYPWFFLVNYFTKDFFELKSTILMQAAYAKISIGCNLSPFTGSIVL